MVNRNTPDVQREFAESRGGNFKMVTDPDMRFSKDMGFWKKGANAAGRASPRSAKRPTAV